MKKNVGGQKIGAQLVSATDGSEFTGAVTVYVTGDAGTQAVGSVSSGACTHEGHGYHTYAPAQAETNYDLTAFTFIGTGAIPATVQIFNSFPQTVDNATNISAIKTKTDSLTFTVAGQVDSNTLKVGGTTQTAIDLGGTRAEPAQGAPGATITAYAKIDYLYKAFRNKVTQTATGLSIYNDAGSIVDHKGTVSDDGTTFTKPLIVAGP